MQINRVTSVALENAHMQKQVKTFRMSLCTFTIIISLHECAKTNHSKTCQI